MASHPASATSSHEWNDTFMPGDIARYVPPKGSEYNFPRFRFPNFEHLEDVYIRHYVVILSGWKVFKAVDHTIPIPRYQCLIVSPPDCTLSYLLTPQVSTNPFDPQASIEDASLRRYIAGHGPKDRIRRGHPFYALFTETTLARGAWDWKANSAVTLNVVEIPRELLRVFQPRGEMSRCRLINMSRHDLFAYLTEFGMDEPRNWNRSRSDLPSLTTTEPMSDTLSHYRSFGNATRQFRFHTATSMPSNTPEASPAHATEFQHTTHSTTATTGLSQTSLRAYDPPSSTTTAGSVGSWDDSSDTTLVEEPEDVDHHLPSQSTSPDEWFELTERPVRRWPKQSWTHPPLQVGFTVTGQRLPPCHRGTSRQPFLTWR